MCVLILCKERSLTEEEFTEAWSRNKDGFGYAYNKDNRIYFKKGMMDKDEAYEEYKKVKVLPHIAHFRLGSPVCPELTHPFIVNEESDLILEGETDYPVIFHNGVVSGWEKWMLNVFLAIKKIPLGEWSDTRLVAIICHLLGIEALQYIEGKYLVLTKDDIIMSGKFEDEKDGLIASNTTYIKSKYTYSSQNTCYSGMPRCQQDEFFL